MSEVIQQYTLKEQVERAVQQVDMLFGEAPAMPEEMTREEMWAEILKLRGLVKKPKVQSAIKLLLEAKEMSGLPIPLIANIIQAGFKKHGFDCNCSESSVRWYISQKTLEWDIVQRQVPKVQG